MKPESGKTGTSKTPLLFRNAANTDFTAAANREKQRAAMAAVGDPNRPGSAGSIRVGRKHPLVIGGRKAAVVHETPFVETAYAAGD